MSLFTGQPLITQSFSSSTDTTPAWMQQAIYNLVSQAGTVASLPYQPYTGQRVADPSAAQTSAWDKVTQQQGAWQPGLTAAQQGTQALTGQTPGTTAADPYRAQQGGLLGAMNYNAPAQTLDPYVQQAMGTSGINAAQPYLNQAGQSSVANIQDYMNPYTSQVTDRIAALGGRNLQENLLPSVSDAFIKAGGFGGNRMGEFGSRALRDTQEAVLAEQSKALQAGYGQALGASQADLSRQGQLGQMAGQLTGQQQQALLSGGQALTSAQQQALSQAMQGSAQYGAMGQQAGQLAQTDASQQMSGYNQLGVLSQAQQQMGSADIAQLSAVGTEQQGQQQRVLDTAYQDWQNQEQHPTRTMDWLQNQIRGIQGSVPTTSTQANTTSGAAYSPSPLAQVASALSLYKGLS